MESDTIIQPSRLCILTWLGLWKIELQAGIQVGKLISPENGVAAVDENNTFQKTR